MHHHFKMAHNREFQRKILESCFYDGGGGGVIWVREKVRKGGKFTALRIVLMSKQ